MYNILSISNLNPSNVMKCKYTRKDGRPHLPEERIGNITGDNTYILTAPHDENMEAFFTGIKAFAGGLPAITDTNGLGSAGNGWLVEFKLLSQSRLKGGWTCSLSLFDATTSTTDGNRQEVSPYSTGNNYPVPTFSYDNDNGLINYNIDKTYYELLLRTNSQSATQNILPNYVNSVGGGGWGVLLNHNLNNLLEFNTSPITDTYYKPSVWDLSLPYNSFLGRNIDPINNQTHSLLINLNKLKDTGSTTFVVNEVLNSGFLRRNLHSIIFASNVISVRGELLNIGNKSRKVLTDFELNTDDIQTYIQFYSQGYMRYYPLESNLPLREMGLKVYYETAQGEIFDFNLPNNSIATIKIEFKPKNQLAIQQSSS
tara:strand:- start:25 stop:1134 length:1110 start_codon:yes stop_codon:yes gene_type:complete